MPGYVNYYYKHGELPQSTKKFFNENNILTVHGVIAKNALTLLHRIKYFAPTVPSTICDSFPENMPTVNSDHITASTWLDCYNSTHFRSSVFYKGPLLSVHADKNNVSTLRALFSINIYKSSVKRFLLESQKDGNDESWPNFVLNNVPGLRRSQRNDRSN